MLVGGCCFGGDGSGDDGVEKVVVVINRRRRGSVSKDREKETQKEKRGKRIRTWQTSRAVFVDS